MLWDHMSSVGTVVDAHVKMDGATGRSRGQGIVTYRSSDDANEAVRTLHDTDLDGRLILVKLDGGSSAAPRGARAEVRGGGESDVCFDFQSGTCTRGASCRFSHGGGESGGGGGARRSGGGGFSGECNSCGKTGHRSRDCPSAQESLAGGKGGKGRRVASSAQTLDEDMDSYFGRADAAKASAPTKSASGGRGRGKPADASELDGDMESYFAASKAAKKSQAGDA
jgi:hypothetical protein